MKMIRVPRLATCGSLLLALSGLWAAHAQETPPPPPPPTPSPQEQAAPPADPETMPPTSETPVEAPVGQAEPPAEGSAPLRRLDGETGNETSSTPESSGPERPRSTRSERVGRQIVTQGSDATLAEGDAADEVVAIFGDAFSHGRVVGDVVAVMGDATVTGSVGGEVVAVFGDVEVNGPVDGDIVAVIGGVTLGPNADVKGEVVCIGGKLNKHPSAKIRKGVNEVGSFFDVPQLDGLKEWFRRALVFGRPLAFGPNLGWAWAVASVFLAFYVLLALAFGRGVEKCAETLEQRPGYTILASFLTLLATPVLLVVLAITGVGPFLLMFALLFAALFGKAAFLTWIGRRLTKPLGLSAPFIATAIGGVIMLALYVVPVLGMLVWAGGGVLGLGMAVYTLMLAMKREKPAAARLAPGGAGPAGTSVGASGSTIGQTGYTTTPPLGGTAAGTDIAGAMATGVAFEPQNQSQGQSQSPGYAGAAEAPPLPGSTDAAGAVGSSPRSGGDPWPRVNAPVISALSLPRVGFWLRLGAAVLDAILVGVVAGILHIDGFFPLLYTAYCVVLWTLKGTTVGGIICSLKLVRVDDRKIDWSIAIVRALGGFLSLAVAGLGFIWVAFDDDRQSWHDKIAGTTIVRVPRGVSLV